MHEDLQPISQRAPERAHDDPNELHRALLRLNSGRLRPSTPDEPFEIEHEMWSVAREERFLTEERRKVQVLAATAPDRAEDFVEWFVALEQDGPGQHDPLFDWLAGQANRDQMRWFIAQEMAGEAGFDDLVALAQRKMDARAKLEMARNYWDEMGTGHAAGMHGPMLERLVSDLDVGGDRSPPYVWEAIALANVMMGLAYNRRYAYHGIGALGAVELTAPGRCQKVDEGLRRLGLSGGARRYYSLHAVIDLRHAQQWNAEVLSPLVDADARRAKWIAEGALMRLEAGRRTFARYKRHFGLES